MIRREYVEFTEVHKNYECRLLVPVGMQIQDAFDCSVRMAQVLGNSIKEMQEKEETKDVEDGIENEASKD